MLRLRLLVLVASVPLIAMAIAVARPRPSGDLLRDIANPYEYSLTKWEFRHFLNKWLFVIGGLFRDHSLSHEEADDLLAYYFSLVNETNDLSRRIDDAKAKNDDITSLSDELEEKEAEQRRLRNAVEAIIEGRISTVLGDQGLKRSLPIFSDVRFVFPPVDFELAGPPLALVISPRDRIELERVFLLSDEINTLDMQQLEAKAETTGVSALVVRTGGVASYPSVVPDSAGYESVLGTVAHEWVHQYLFFSPLGRRYFKSEELRTINETVANIAGREIARLVQERYPKGSAEPSGGPSRGASASSGIDFNREMRSLRRQVDELLALGKVEDAETLMEEKRRFLAENGYYIRKINQAYFAWHGIYADTPSSSSPIGPKLEELRQNSTSVGDFLRRAGQITSAADLDRLLSELSTSSPP